MSGFIYGWSCTWQGQSGNNRYLHGIGPMQCQQASTAPSAAVQSGAMTVTQILKQQQIIAFWLFWSGLACSKQGLHNVLVALGAGQHQGSTPIVVMRIHLKALLQHLHTYAQICQSTFKQQHRLRQTQPDTKLLIGATLQVALLLQAVPALKCSATISAQSLTLWAAAITICSCKLACLSPSELLPTPSCNLKHAMVQPCSSESG